MCYFQAVDKAQIRPANWTTVNIDALIGDYIRQYNQHKLSFPPVSAGTSLPAPVAGRHYLLYLHIPFCAVLCPFCSFHRVQFEPGSALNYFDCLRREISLVTDSGYRFDELYVGGGTPTVDPDELAKTIESVRENHSITGISVETNPDDLAKDSMTALCDVGVNRLSVGVQSFDDELLREMLRFEKYGSGEEISKRLRQAEGHFDTLNVDMIFNMPHQTEDSLRRDLKILTDEVGVDQVSFYPLMTVNSTRKKMQQSMGSVDYDREREYYEIIASHMLACGYVRTSAWCFSRKPGLFDEYIVEREEYLGLGSGSFSYLDGKLYSSTFSINHYLQLVRAGKTGTFGCLELSNRDQMRYYLLMQLFSGSLDKTAAEERFGGRFQRTLWAELTMLQTIGAVRNTGVQLRLTERGYYIWVMLMRNFFTGVNNLRDQMRHNISRETAILGSA
jgi:coproporphyrinogen III oxidase-like Fe-S oxidoreductase